MATAQLPATKYTIGGQVTVSGWQVISSAWGIEEDAETKYNAAGQFEAEVVYSRRKTLNLTMEADHGTTVTAYDTGGSITISEVVYEIRSVQRTNTRGPVQVTLDLISTVDLLA